MARVSRARADYNTNKNINQTMVRNINQLASQRAHTRRAPGHIIHNDNMILYVRCVRKS
jgi:hypothetical protein